MATAEYHEVVVDFGEICRLCLKSEEFLIKILTDDTQIYEKVKSITGIDVKEVDGFPEWICNSCNIALTDIQSFLETCMTSQTALQQSFCQALIDAGVNDMINKKLFHKTVTGPIETLVFTTGSDNENLSETALSSSRSTIRASLSDHESELELKPVSVEIDDSVVSDQEKPNIWKCDHCGLGFNSKRAISIHVRVKHLNKPKNKKTMCKFCGDVIRGGNRQKHWNDVHHLTSNEIIDCKLCLKPFHKQLYLDKHVNSCHQKNLEKFAELTDARLAWKCPACYLLFSSFDQLQIHSKGLHDSVLGSADKLQVVRDQELFCKCGTICCNLTELFFHQLFTHDLQCTTCQLCQSQFESTDEIKHHLISHHRIFCLSCDKICPLCQIRQEDYPTLRKHLTSTHQIHFQQHEETSNRSYQTNCGYCNIRFNSKGDLDAHLNECKSKVQLTCFVCNRTYTSEYRLKRHVYEYHRAYQPIACPDCGKVFTRKINLHNHYKRRHLNTTKCFICSFCGSALKGRVALKSHEDRVHRNVREFKCNKCPLSFTTRSILNQHVNRHSSDRPFHHCHYCDRKFTTYSGIERHIKVHEGVKNFVCSKCGRAFYTKHELARHTRFHTRDFKHTCSVCFKTFATPYDLKKHSTKHTGLKPYKCLECTMIYSRRDDLVKHLRKVHQLRVKKVYGRPPSEGNEQFIVERITPDGSNSEELKLFLLTQNEEIIHVTPSSTQPLITLL